MSADNLLKAMESRALDILTKRAAEGEPDPAREFFSSPLLSDAPWHEVLRFIDSVHTGRYMA